MIVRISLICIVFCTFGCVSAWIDNGVGRFRNTFKQGATKQSIRQDIGKPTSISGSYDIFEVVGKIHKPGDGSAQATTNAITLGTGEVIMLPMTIIGVIGKSFQKHKIIVHYDDKGNYVKHELFDSKGRKESISGY